MCKLCKLIKQNYPDYNYCPYCGDKFKSFVHINKDDSVFIPDEIIQKYTSTSHTIGPIIMNKKRY